MICSGQCRMGTHDFPLSPGSMAMQIHNIGSRLDKLSRPSGQQHLPDAQFRGTVQQIPQIVAAQHDSSGTGISALQIGLAGIAGHKGAGSAIFCPAHGKLQPERLPDCFFTHGAHHTGSAQNGNAPCDSQSAVKCFFRNLGTAGNGNGDFCPGCSDYTAHCLLHHLPGNRVDSRLSHRNFQSLPGHCSHAFAAQEANPARF